jgi:hypothetical protein
MCALECAAAVMLTLAAGSAAAQAMQSRSEMRAVAGSPFRLSLSQGPRSVVPPVGELTTQLGLEWQPTRSTLGFEPGALGLQLNTGYRLSLKARHGAPVLYLRTTF